MNVSHLISLVEKVGGQLLAEGENIRVINIKLLAPSLVEEIKSHKAILLKQLNQDLIAKKAGFIVALSGSLYTQTLGKNSSVYIERIGTQWETWRETHIQGKKVPVEYRMIAAGEFEYVILKAKEYFGYIERKRSSGN
ncbi:hypothetical protein ABES02_04400 [Neobacillus pocheonensis]|uniref:hypothetical protein n=1 Tax=Neobacillus pocheonensis TaxID=363869 RepID=UPI003D2A762F